MAKKRRPTNRPARSRAHLSVVPPPDESIEAALLKPFRQALRSDDPLVLLQSVGMLLAATDPRTVSMFERRDPAELGELIDSFIGTPYAETTAVLAVMRALLTDAVLVERIERELAGRRHPMPDWLKRLDEVRVEPQVWFLGHVLGDGDDYLIGLTFATGQRFTVLVYVDHNLGTLVKDAFFMPVPLEEVVARMEAELSDPDQVLTTVDPATARSAVTAAIELGLITVPPLESDTWPACRAMVEWAVSMLPDGGVAPERPQWSVEQLADLTEDFFASRFGAPIDGPEARGLLGSILWFGTDYSTGDPLRWSPVNVDIILTDWAPRKILADPTYLTQLPDVLREFIRYAHERQGIRAELTADTLESLDAYAPEFVREVNAGHRTGTAAALAGMLGLEGPQYGLPASPLERAVGGEEALAALDGDPLPAEEFDIDGILEDVLDACVETLEHCDRCADALLDVEHRTAARRFLRDVALGDPAIFRRNSSRVRGAAAIIWVIGRANGTVGQGGMPLRELMHWFGLTGTPSQRAEPMLRAIGVDPYLLPSGRMYLGRPDLLVSARRRQIIEQRDRDGW